MGRKNILVVGGAAGIGRRIAEDFIAEGNRVAIADRNAKAGEDLVRAFREQGSLADFYGMDVCSWDDTKRVAEQIRKEMKRLDILVYSAGITRLVSFNQLDWEEWKRTIEVNLTGLFYTVRSVTPIMVEQGEGNILIIGSASAISGSGGGVHYAASKGGAFGFMRALARELGPQGIRINVVAPRSIESEMLNRLYPEESGRERLKHRIPLGRLGTVADVSNVVRFLCSEESGYIHGQVIVLDGGRTFCS